MLKETSKKHQGSRWVFGETKRIMIVIK